MTSFKTTLVVGATEKTDRYANKAIKLLNAKMHPVLAYGRRSGKVGNTEIVTDLGSFKNIPIDTVTLYINPTHQTELYKAIIDLKPKRVIFNPGTENPEFETLLNENNIETEEACTLVLLNTRQY